MKQFPNGIQASKFQVFNFFIASDTAKPVDKSTPHKPELGEQCGLMPGHLMK